MGVCRDHRGWSAGSRGRVRPVRGHINCARSNKQPDYNPNWPVFSTDTQVQTSHNPLTLSQIANIQPGLGTVMIEYAIRFDNLWFAAQKSNWAMVSYQIDEMREIQEVGEITRSNRAAMLKNFESSFLDPLATAAKNKDLTAFTTAYDGAIGGCNACHAASSGKADDGTPIPSYKFVKIARPTAPDFNNVDWTGQ